MDKNYLKKIKEVLEKEKKNLNAELQRFAKKDKILAHDWDTMFPKFDNGTDNQALEDRAGEVEEYISKLPLEYKLEIKLRDVNLALEKIKKGTYGQCEKCGQKIPKERLNACPEARLCLKCASK